MKKSIVNQLINRCSEARCKDVYDRFLLRVIRTKMKENLSNSKYVIDLELELLRIIDEYLFKFILNRFKKEHKLDKWIKDKNYKKYETLAIKFIKEMDDRYLTKENIYFESFMEFLEDKTNKLFDKLFHGFNPFETIK